MQLETLWDLAVPLAIGVVIGTERGWSQRKEAEGMRVAGLRTFALTGLFGGLAALLAQSFGMWFLPAAALGLAAILAVSYFRETPRTNDYGITSEVAVLLTFALGAWSVADRKLEALSVAVVVTAILSLKTALHRWLRVLTVNEVYAGIKLLLISVVLLPMLPNEGYGPYGALNPRWIWWMVVLISGLSFLGYVAMKSAGQRAGAYITSITGALVSSTAVTLSLAKLARQAVKKDLMISAAILASAVMVLRVAFEVFVVNRALLQAIWPPVMAMLVTLLAGAAWIFVRDQKSESLQEIQIGNPLDLKTAIKFGILLAVIVLLSRFLSDRYGDEGIIVTALLAGVADVDAITLSLSEMAKSEITESLAALGIILASVSNTFVKAGIFAYYVGWKHSYRFLLVLCAAGAAGLLAVLLGG